MDRVVLVSRAYQTQSDAVFRVVYRAGRDSGDQSEMENFNRNLMSPVAELAWRESALVEPMRAEPTRVEPKTATEDAPLVSVVIPSYNSARTIRKCLSGLSAQRTTLPFEVIIADSSDDGTEQIVSTEFPEVKLLHFDGRRSTGIARNFGIDAARGDIILFLDTDCVPNLKWIDQMVVGIFNGV